MASWKQAYITYRETSYSIILSQHEQAVVKPISVPAHTSPITIEPRATLAWTSLRPAHLPSVSGPCFLNQRLQPAYPDVRDVRTSSDGSARGNKLATVHV